MNQDFTVGKLTAKFIRLFELLHNMQYLLEFKSFKLQTWFLNRIYCLCEVSRCVWVCKSTIDTAMVGLSTLKFKASTLNLIMHMYKHALCQNDYFNIFSQSFFKCNWFTKPFQIVQQLKSN